MLTVKEEARDALVEIIVVAFFIADAGRRLHRGCRRARCALGDRLLRFALLFKAGRDDRDDDGITQLLVDGDTEDRIDLSAGRILNDRNGALCIVQRYLVAAGNIDDRTLGTGDLRLQQR